METFMIHTGFYEKCVSSGEDCSSSFDAHMPIAMRLKFLQA